MNIEFFSIDRVDEISGTLTLLVWLRTMWTNELLAWNPANHSGIDHVIANRNLFWQPDLVLYNSAVQPWDQHVHTTKTWVYPDGESWDSTPASLTFECRYEFDTFPFDVQNCSMRFASWNYVESQLDMQARPLYVCTHSSRHLYVYVASNNT